MWRQAPLPDFSADQERPKRRWFLDFNIHFPNDRTKTSRLRPNFLYPFSRRLGELEWLILDGTKVTNAGMQQIKGLSKLKTLYTSKTRVGDDGLAFIAELGQLERLKINETPISDRGLLKLKGLKSLTYLEIHQTAVTDDAIEELRRALPKLEVVTHRNY